MLVLPFSLSSLHLLQPSSVTAERLVGSKVVRERDALAQGLFPDVFHVDSTTVGPELVSPTKFEDLLGQPKV